MLMFRRLFIIGAACLSCLGAAGAADRESDGRLLDELVGRQVSPQAAPGAAAVLVRRDGSVELRGYGMADLATQTPVDAASTVFRVGSITKTFTALAILQLVDEGKVDLQADANRYLKGVQIPAGAAPVRVLDLLTHRSGFDGELSFVGLDDAQAAAQSSDARLQRDIHRLRPAGELAVYDNLAWGLLGHIVESVDGMSYAKAIERRIFLPLGMQHSQVGLPANSTAQAYEVGPDGQAQLKPQIHLRRGWQGAGDISTTAADMARFLSAMLAEGQYPGGRLLTAPMFKRFSDSSQFRLNPGLAGTGLGVYALGRFDGGAFGHGGTIRGFNALFMVLPQQGLAFFAVMNLNKAAPELTLSGLLDYVAHPPGDGPLDPTDYMIIDLPELLAQRFQASAAAAATAPTTRADWSGRYAGLRMQSFEGLLPRVAATLFLPSRKVSQQADGSLQIGAQGPYRLIGTDLYALDKPLGPLFDRIGFANAAGHAVMAPHTLQASRRLAWYERPVLTAGGLLLAPLLLLIAALLHWAFSSCGNARYDGWLALAAFALLAGLLAEVSWAGLLSRETDQGWLVTLWRCAINAALLAMAAVAVRGLRHAWLNSSEAFAPRPGRIHAGAMAALASWILLAAAYWQLIGRF